MSTIVSSLRFTTWQRLSWPRPEWWAMGLCVGGWLLILLKSVGTGASHIHASHHAPPAGIDSSSLSPALWWLAMVVAMMFPVLVDPIRNTAARSLWNRRHRSIAAFLAGYLAPWLFFGLAALEMLKIVKLESWMHSRSSAALGLGVALAWQLTPIKRRSVLTCHRTLPLAPTGWRADRDCMHYGWMVGGWCVISCWALMLACLLSGHSLPIMAIATGITWVERKKPRPNKRLLCGVIAALGLIYFIVPYI